MQVGDTYLGRKVLYIERFPAQGTFQAFRKAEERLRELGYTIGSMCRNEPIGFADDHQYDYVAKWYNIAPEEKLSLDGVIVSSDFREGSSEIVWLTPPKF